MTGLAAALALIAKRGALRTDALAAELGVGENAVDAMLEPACADGRLTTCKVTTGGRSVTEYRCSAAGGLFAFTIAPPSRKTYQPPPAHRVAAPADQHADTKGEDTMKTLAERIKAALLEHGPMTSRELRKHVDDDRVANHCFMLTQSGQLGVLGGGARSKIYGLPDQNLSARKEPLQADASVDIDGVHKRTTKAKKKAQKKAGSKAAKKAWKTRRANAGRWRSRPAKSFRPALTADGAILFLGAKKGEFEIPRADTRALVDLVRKLTGPELAVAVGFIERLDRAEVAA